MQRLLKPIQIQQPVLQRMDNARSDCSADEDLSFIEILRAEAQNPMIKNFSQEDSIVDDTKDLEEFLNSLD
ncbi:unnamed protein product [Paramecium primaurelia]|uniref:Uncharacterized protein n=2 Tax=Paramecium TaxID=5884 RepID=A0A8S1W2T2_9CILI|nr:unnamed protein product [Paramecium primaurelia]CAD8184688.1 unnamed protein product [Paramecium pentaurelia]